MIADKVKVVVCLELGVSIAVGMERLTFGSQLAGNPLGVSIAVGRKRLMIVVIG